MASSEPTQVTGLGLTIPPGTRLNGIFEIERQIGAGGMGMVYRAHNVETGDAVAIKIVRAEMAGNEQVLALFRKEAAVLHRLLHDAIVRYYLFTSDPDIGRPYLATEFVDGTSLADMGAIGRDDVLALADRLASGLQAAHDVAIFHRDISPDNVILPARDVRKAKIIDFGIARAAAVGGGTVIGDQIAGKFDYMSPEQLGLYGGQVDARSDIYSLGIVLSEAVLGRGLGMGGSQLEVIEKRRKVPDLSGIEPRLRALLAQMLQPRPEDRIATMAAVAETARQIGSGSARVAGRSKLPRLVAGIGVLVLVGGGAWYLLGGPGGDAPQTPSAPPPLVRQSAETDAAPPVLSRTAPDADRTSPAREDTTASTDVAAPDTAPSLGDGERADAATPPADEVETAAADTAQQAAAPSRDDTTTRDEPTPPVAETTTEPSADQTATPVTPPADATAAADATGEDAPAPSDNATAPTDSESARAAADPAAPDPEPAPADTAPSAETAGTGTSAPATPDADDDATTAPPAPQDNAPPASDTAETSADGSIETAALAPPTPDADAAATTDAAPADTIETNADAPSDVTAPDTPDLANADDTAPPADETAATDAAGQEEPPQEDGAATLADNDTETAAPAPDTEPVPDEAATASTETPPVDNGETADLATSDTRPDAGDLATLDTAPPPADATTGAAGPDAPPSGDTPDPQTDGAFETAVLAPDTATTGDEDARAQSDDAQAGSDGETTALSPATPQAGDEGAAPRAETVGEGSGAARENAAQPDTGEGETATTPPANEIETAALADDAATAATPDDAAQPPAVPDESAAQPVADNTETAMLAPTDTPLDDATDDTATDTSAPPKSAVAAFVDDAALGPCTFVELAREGPQSAAIIAYGTEIPPFERFDAGFRDTLGFSADINLRPVSDAQCPAVVLAEALKGGPPLSLTLKSDILTPGGILSGTVTGIGDRAVHLYLVAGDGHLYGLAEMMEIDGDTATFGTVMAGTSDGPPQHLLIAVAADTLPDLEAKADGNRAIDLAALIDTLEGDPAASAALGYFKYGP